ncbi:ATP-binding protein [Nocardioides sp.]|uniref:hybrid sensor histidine kinase/response regulator n=1 Tax=Nocardioides sp. TaxID=35761 RepID=UPI00286D9B89|nr:ATP-binding protein [Nocardioides sp.]
MATHSELDHDPARELRDAREHLEATREVLGALGRSGDDPSAVLDVVVERAASLCEAQAAQLYLIDGDDLRLSRVSGANARQMREYLLQHPLSLDRTSLSGRVALDRRTQQIRDVLADPEFGRRDLQQLFGFRTSVSAPLLFESDVVGTLTLWRAEVDPFDERAIALLESFATQATIVLRQVELTRALAARGRELAAKIDQLEALSEVADAVSSSLDPDEVLQRIVASAVRLTGTDGGSIMEYDAATDTFHVRAAHGSSTALLRRLRRVTIRRDSSLVGRAATAHRSVAVADLGGVSRDPHLDELYRDGWRSVLAVPMLRQDQLVGALVVRRRTTGDFPDDVGVLLQSLANQSALAIVNARMFRELSISRRDLEVAGRHKSEFLASMSHELRTPLNAVIGFSDVLLGGMFGELNERQEEYLGDILSSGRHLLELLNEILDLSKIEAGQMRLESTVFSVPAALEYALSVVRERASRHGIDLTLEVGDDVGLVESDELRFKQVVVNLVGNAVKFTPSGGAVGVRARRQAGELVVSVSDTGIGIPAEDREKIFESFQQGGRGLVKEEGTGLGLTLCRRIVELFGGRITLESEVGQGSRFEVCIPMTPYRQVVEGPAAAGRGGAILLVDDDRASLELMAAHLEGTAPHVLRAHDGEMALELARRTAPSAVVLDILLPGLDGWQVLSRLRQDPATAGIPVIVASVVDDRARGAELGAAAYLVKPLAREELVTALRRVGALPAEAAGPEEST